MLNRTNLNLKTDADKIEQEIKEILDSIANSDPARSQQISNDLAAIPDMIKRDFSVRATSHHRGEKKSAFDDDIFDAVRTVDLANMVGAWTIGRVLDVKAMRQVHYEGGPVDSSFALTVDVQAVSYTHLTLPTKRIV